MFPREARDGAKAPRQKDVWRERSPSDQRDTKGRKVRSGLGRALQLLWDAQGGRQPGEVWSTGSIWPRQYRLQGKQGQKQEKRLGDSNQPAEKLQGLEPDTEAEGVRSKGTWIYFEGKDDSTVNKPDVG